MTPEVTDPQWGNSSELPLMCLTMQLQSLSPPTPPTSWCVASASPAVCTPTRQDIIHQARHHHLSWKCVCVSVCVSVCVQSTYTFVCVCLWVCVGGGGGSGKSASGLLGGGGACLAATLAYPPSRSRSHA